MLSAIALIRIEKLTEKTIEEQSTMFKGQHFYPFKNRNRQSKALCAKTICKRSDNRG